MRIFSTCALVIVCFCWSLIIRNSVTLNKMNDPRLAATPALKWASTFAINPFAHPHTQRPPSHIWNIITQWSSNKWERERKNASVFDSINVYLCMLLKNWIHEKTKRLKKIIIWGEKSQNFIDLKIFRKLTIWARKLKHYLRYSLLIKTWVPNFSSLV